MRVIALLMVALVAGCAGAMKTKIVSSSPRTVSVESFNGMADAIQLAETECLKYGLHARWVSGKVTYIFDCVP